ncbi:hypothetical protein ACSBR1_018894 [Camellia fascicularis]
MMHQLLRDMGREIIRQESPKEPGKRSRGTETIEGFILDLCVLQEDMQGKSVNNTQHHHFDNLWTTIYQSVGVMAYSLGFPHILSQQNQMKKSI